MSDSVNLSGNKSHWPRVYRNNKNLTETVEESATTVTFNVIASSRLESFLLGQFAAHSQNAWHEVDDELHKGMRNHCKQPSLEQIIHFRIILLVPYRLALHDSKGRHIQDVETFAEMAQIVEESYEPGCHRNNRKVEYLSNAANVLQTADANLSWFPRFGKKPGKTTVNPGEADVGAPGSQTNKRGFKVPVPSTDTALEIMISERKYNCLRSNTLNTLHFAYPKFNEKAFFSNGYDKNMNLRGLRAKIQREGFVPIPFHELTLDQVKQLIQRFPHNMFLEVPVSNRMSHLIGIVTKDNAVHVIDGNHPQEKPFLFTEEHFGWIRGKHNRKVKGFLFFPGGNTWKRLGCVGINPVPDREREHVKSFIGELKSRGQ